MRTIPYNAVINVTATPQRLCTEQQVSLMVYKSTIACPSSNAGTVYLGDADAQSQELYPEDAMDLGGRNHLYGFFVKGTPGDKLIITGEREAAE